MFGATPLPLLLAACTGVVLLALLLLGRPSRSDARLSELADELVITNKSSARPAQSLMELELSRRLESDKRKDSLRLRLLHAGFYGPNAARLFLALRYGSLLVPVCLGWCVGHLTDIPMQTAIMVGSLVGFTGVVLPPFLLDARKKARQQKIRRALPDAMDILTICLDGGLSLSAAIARVSTELAGAHPELALELTIVDCETRMGRSTSESLKSFANRFDQEELRSLATVVAQAERFGTSVGSAMDVFAETMRMKRSQAAEVKAQYAVIKCIFPTLLCIFPALFVVIMGPAAIRVARLFSDMTVSP